jgi:hypothetical protein
MFDGMRESRIHRDLAEFWPPEMRPVRNVRELVRLFLACPLLSCACA